MNHFSKPFSPNAVDAGDLVRRSIAFTDAASALVSNLDDTVLLGCVGLSADELDSPDATLVSIVLDMSGSMAPHQKAVVDAYNQMLRAFSGAKSSTAILASAWAFSDKPALLSSYEPTPRKPPLCSAVYRPNGMTALHDAILGALTGLVAYGQRLWDEGVPTKRILFVLSDGDDNASKATAPEVRSALAALARDEAYTLAYAGFGGDQAGQAARLGFPNVVSVGATDKDLRRLFGQLSQSVLRVSQGTGSLAGGFFAP